MKTLAATTDNLARSATRRRMAGWQAVGRQYSLLAAEMWHLRLPLMTMVGLTLLGVYDCTAAARQAGWEPAPTVQTAGAPAAATAAAAREEVSARVPVAFDPRSLGWVAQPAAAERETGSGAVRVLAGVERLAAQPATVGPPRV